MTLKLLRRLSEYGFKAGSEKWATSGHQTLLLTPLFVDLTNYSYNSARNDEKVSANAGQSATVIRGGKDSCSGSVSSYATVNSEWLHG
jgi:hypothetical protein